MSLSVIRRVRDVKRLRADRAEQTYRRARAFLAQAEGAVAEGRRVLAAWIEDQPTKIAAIYEPAIGAELDLKDLDTLKRRVIALSEHRLLLEHRVRDLEGAARQAKERMQEAAESQAKARRGVDKFNELTEVLRKAEVLETERREDAELEELAEQLAQRAEEDFDGDDITA